LRPLPPKTASRCRSSAPARGVLFDSNTQRGLGGISFGSFLIKQVVEELRRELPSWRIRNVSPCRAS